MAQTRRISIWFYVGVLVTTYGVLILGAGLEQVRYPPQPPVVLERLHFGVWWGAILLIIGLIWTIHFRPHRRPSPQRTEKS